MMTKTTEIADGIFRISTCVPGVTPDGFTFNQFLIKAEEPLLFHTGPRGMFPLVAEAMSKVVAIEKLQWITFGHVEADECGSMNQWLDAAPRSQVAHGALGVMVSLNDLAVRPLEETTCTLLCGDLFSHTGDGPAITSEDIVEPDRKAEELFHATCLTPTTGATIRQLAALSPKTLALMHGSSFNGDAIRALNDLADLYDGWLREALQTNLC
jgi:ODP family beta-lactamase